MDNFLFEVFLGGGALRPNPNLGLPLTVVGRVIWLPLTWTVGWVTSTDEILVERDITVWAPAGLQPLFGGFEELEGGPVTCYYQHTVDNLIMSF